MKKDLTTTNQWVEKLTKSLENEEEAFRHIPADLLSTYDGQFVAIAGGQIIDHDNDELSLARRVSQLPKSKFIVIRQVKLLTAH